MNDKITPCFYFDGNAEEAVNFYVSLLDNSRIIETTYYGPQASMPQGAVMTIQFELQDRRFMAINGGPDFKFSPAISMVAYCDKQQEFDELWNSLSEGGATMACGWLTDRFGVSWQIVPSILPELMASDAEKSNRVMQTLWGKVKVDMSSAGGGGSITKGLGCSRSRRATHVINRPYGETRSCRSEQRPKPMQCGRRPFRRQFLSHRSIAQFDDSEVVKPDPVFGISWTVVARDAYLVAIGRRTLPGCRCLKLALEVLSKVRHPLCFVGGVIACFVALTAPVLAQGWVHPAGLLDVATLEEMKHKSESLEWARKVVENLDAGAQPWLMQPLERIEELMPKRKTQVYWLMTCPMCRGSLRFDPFNDKEATCHQCNKTSTLDLPSTATVPNSPYAGTLYEGWGCYYLQAMARTAQRLALLHALGADRSYAERGAAILKLFAKHIKPLPVQGSGTQRVIWTYNIEGDVSLLMDLAPAYELLRNVNGLFSQEEHRAIQFDLLKHWIDAVVRVERDSSPNHNSMYTYLSVAALVGCAIEDTDYVDWAFGRRAYSSEKRPHHRSLAWLTDNNYQADGGFWGMCSAYHLYALGPNCRALVLGHRLSRQMPDLFPPAIYDELDPQNPRSRRLRRAVKWFTSQTFPDLTMAPFGDMGGRVSLATYSLAAEIGYRYLGIDEVGSYRALREGSRGMEGLMYGADTIEEKPVSYQSANLSSGYVALKREADGNRLYAGLNALMPGGGHQHGDRLNLITYSRDRMLTGEKRTYYSDPDQRVYSGASYAHNTVTVDETSQVHGNYLKDDRIPRIDTFVDLPAATVAEAHGDRVYEQTSVYRRLICQFDEYALDIFRVQGGEVHDWLYHGVGEEPVISIPMEHRTGFEPSLYVMRGEADYKEGAADDTFTATWRLPAEPGSEFAGRRRDVFSHVILAGVPGQTAFVLSTFPDPGKHSLMVRHQETTVPFVALHEAYFDTPVATGVRLLPADAVAMEITHADGGRRLAFYESGSGPADWLLRGRFATIEIDASDRLRSLVLVCGTELRYDSLHLRADREVSLSVTCDGRGARLVSSPPVAYETQEGLPIYAAGLDTTVWLTVSTPSSPTGKEIRKRVLVPGQAKDGPVPVEVRW